MSMSNVGSVASAPSGASAEAICAHYDVSNDFYALWLDPTMSYSCALWDEGDDLEAAQLRKMDFHLDAVGARERRNLLDVGCGWGGLLRRARGHYGVSKTTGLTLSTAQFEWSKARGDLDVRLQSWATHQPSEPYDAIISVGAFEHFAKDGLAKADRLAIYRDFFAWCHDHSAPGAAISVQSIVYENYDEAQPNPFVREIFPESDLPRLAEICEACEGLFEITAIRNDREHYARTLRHWYKALRANKRAALELVGEQTYARYEKYLGVFVVGLHTGTVNLSRIAARRIDAAVRLRR